MNNTNKYARKLSFLSKQCLSSNVVVNIENYAVRLYLNKNRCIFRGRHINCYYWHINENKYAVLFMIMKSIKDVYI